MLSYIFVLSLCCWAWLRLVAKAVCSILNSVTRCVSCKELTSRLKGNHKRLLGSDDIVDLPTNVNGLDTITVDLQIDDLVTYWTFEPHLSCPQTLSRKYVS
jgi:hypothetical protein